MHIKDLNTLHNPHTTHTSDTPHTTHTLHSLYAVRVRILLIPRILRIMEDKNLHTWYTPPTLRTSHTPYTTHTLHSRYELILPWTEGWGVKIRILRILPRVGEVKFSILCLSIQNRTLVSNHLYSGEWN